MKKVYLLLRNNKETGPYTLTELVQQTLQPSDLVWIEGESISWSHPSTIEQIQATNNTEAFAVDISTQTSNESLLAAAEKNDVSFFTQSAVSDKFINRRRSTKNERFAAYKDQTDIELIVHKHRTHTVSLAQLIAAGIVTTVIVAVWKSDFTFIPEVNKNISYAATPVVFKVVPPVVNNAATVTKKEAGIAVIQKEPVLIASPVIVKNNSTKKKKKTSFKTEAVSTSIASALPQQPITPKQDKEPAVSTESSAVAATEVKEAPAVTTEAEKTEKKKNLGQALRKLFKKKKKSSDDVALEQKGS